MDPSLTKERADVVLNKEQILSNDIYGYGKPKQPTPADGSTFVTGRLPDVADLGIPYGVPISLLEEFKKAAQALTPYVEARRAQADAINKWLKENNYTVEQYNSNVFLPGTKKSVYDLFNQLPEMDALQKTLAQSREMYTNAKNSYNQAYYNLMSTKKMGKIIKPGSMDLKIFGGRRRRSRRFRNRIRKTRRFRRT